MVSGREFDDTFTLKGENALGRGEKSVGAPADSSVERGRKVVRGANVLDHQLHSQGSGRILELLYLRRRDRVYEVSEHQHVRDLWRGLLQQRETLGSKAGRHECLPGDISARPGEARDEPGTDGVAEWPLPRCSTSGSSA